MMGPQCRGSHADAVAPARRDFVNDPEEVRLDFEPFFKTAQLADVSDPNVVHTIQAKLDAIGIYLDSEVTRFAMAYYDPKGTRKALQAMIAAVAAPGRRANALPG